MLEDNFPYDGSKSIYQSLESRYVVEVANPGNCMSCQCFVSCIFAHSDIEAVIEALQFMEIDWPRFYGKNFKVTVLDKDLKRGYTSIVSWKDVQSMIGWKTRAGDGV